MKAKHRFNRWSILVLLIGLFLPRLTLAQDAPEGWVWWEAEKPLSSNLPPASESAYRIQNLEKPERLSGGDWLSATAGNKGEPYKVTYEITVPKDGTYTLWVRKFWHHTLFTWSFENGPGGEVTRDTALYDYGQLRPMVGATWADIGTIELKAGKQRLSLTQTIADPAKGGGAFAIDCFALTPFPWAPFGKFKPGEKSGFEEEGWAAFEPGVDTFTDEALVDLRDHNHKICGEKGRLILRDGDLAWEKAPDERARFWGQVIGRETIVATDQAQEMYVRRMAKLGVNMIRLHGAFHGGVEGDPMAISDEYLDRFDHFVATCRKHGVYFMVNTFYDHWLSGNPNGWQFIHPEGRALWQQWTTRLFDRVNPYTGLRNSEDPTIAIIQLSNEDNYFFHSFQPYRAIPTETMVFMEKRYVAWLKEKYGSLEKAVDGWGNFKHNRDDISADRLGLLRVHQLRGSGQRGKDQAAFLVHDYRSITDGFIAHLRDIGYAGLVNNGNWLSADPRVLEPLDKLANLNGEVMSRHGVNLRSVTDLQVFYAIRKGDKYQSVSSLFEPWRYPVMEVHYGDRASMVCEPKASAPNDYRAEWPPVISCWGALQGMDAQLHFAGNLTWLRSNSSKLWGIDSPVFMGQAPACSLIYREGYIKQAPVVIEEKIHRQSLLDLEGAAFATISTMNADEIQPGDLELVRLSKDDNRGLNPLALMVGSMHRSFVDDIKDAGITIDPRVDECIDAERQIVRSVTGELELNWGTGLLRIMAPKAQGAVGFLADAGTIELPDLVISCDNEYASLLCVSLDGKNLADADRILLSIVTEEHDYGYKTKPASLVPRRAKDPVQGVEITDLGHAPIQHRNPAGTLRLKRSDAADMTVIAVDWNGYPLAEIGKADRIELRGNAIQYVIQK
ncbi:MAG: hypothetical protein ACLFUS_03990 [Candidatus Sumerlaeia bacterium]